MSNDIMIDLETLATTPDAVILSIGAVRFNLEAGTVFAGEHETFYRSVSIDSQPNRKMSGDTIAWWMGHGQAAISVFTESKVTLLCALMDLHEWIDPTPGANPYVWSNGADFDLPMLASACSEQGVNLPWKPYAGRCYRTYKNLPGARAVQMARTGTHHNALQDAISQAQHLCAIHAALFKKPEWVPA